MTRSARWAWTVALVALTGVALVLTFLLALSTEPRGFYERNFRWLIGLNVATAALLALVIVIAGIRLVVRLRRGKFGSRLLAKLAAIFALVGVLPGALIYTVSVQFVSRSIEVWFDARVDGALAAGLTLGRTVLEAQARETANKTRVAAERLSDLGPNPSPFLLERLREQLAVREVALVGASGQMVSSTAGLGTNLQSDRAPPNLMRQARASRVASQLEGLDDDVGPGAQAPEGRIRAMAVIPNSELRFSTNPDRYLMVVQTIPTNVATQALAVQSAFREYQQRALAKEGLRRMYLGTLTLVLILAVFGAVLLAVALGNQIARPLLLLAEGMRQVAAGDLGTKPVLAGRDELGGLTRSFADMTEQLGQARNQVQRGVEQQERARTYLQTILDSLSAGVIVFDAKWRIETVNPGATRILRAPLYVYRGRPLAEVPGLEALAQAVSQRFELHKASPEAGERDQWQDSFELTLSAAEQGGTGAVSPAALPGTGGLTLLVRGAVLPQDAKLLVFDDISEVVSAQRSAAWSEVARRLAHEIKNPLTPIQLSAERLQHKLETKLEGADQQMLLRSVATIVAQVQAMKSLVNEFRDYARLPAASLAPLNLNALVNEVLVLYGTAAEHGHLVASCEAGLPDILGDATQLRQVIHNLVQNGLDAVADKPEGRVEVRTETARNDDGALRAVRLKVRDNGPGFSDKVLRRAFEPYVTTKAKGTGLGLAVVRKIADEHGARVRLGNLTGPRDAAAPAGAEVSLSFSKFAPAPGTPEALAAPRVPDADSTLNLPPAS